MVKKIAVFNHKGGVSKTTTSYHLAWMLARKGKRVLMVDADSQCNLTLFGLGYKKFESLYSSNDKNNIKNALEPAFNAEPKLIEPVECIQLRGSQNLFLLPGHIDLTEFEVSLGVSFQLSNAFGVMKNLPGAFNYLISKTAEKYNADFAIIDMNPSLSAINQDILISSDYFLVPASPDFFSLMAIKSLSRILPMWEKWGKSARDVFKDSVYPLPLNTPKFLGYTINDFNLSEGKAQRSFREIMTKIGNVVDETMIGNLEKEGMLLNKDAYKKSERYPSKYCIAEISNFNKLIAISNAESIPIFEINESSLKEPTQKKTLRWFITLYNQIADRVIYLSKQQS